MESHWWTVGQGMSSDFHYKVSLPGQMNWRGEPQSRGEITMVLVRDAEPGGRQRGSHSLWTLRIPEASTSSSGSWGTGGLAFSTPFLMSACAVEISGLEQSLRPALPLTSSGAWAKSFPFSVPQLTYLQSSDVNPFEYCQGIPCAASRGQCHAEYWSEGWVPSRGH